jgi:TrmH family RNA methyltransferase
LDTISIGKHNPRLTDIRKALDRGGLTKDGLLPIEGPKIIHEAVTSGLAVSALFLREGGQFSEALAPGTTYTLEPAIFKGIQSTEHSQGVIALVRPRVWSLKDVLRDSSAPVAVLAALQDPGNVGTILRIAEAFGVAGCLGIRGTASIHNAKTTRASAGSVFRVPHVWDLEWEAVVGALKAARIPLIGTSPHADQSITSWDWTQPAAVLIGNEGAGLTSEQTAACAAVLRIPQQAPVESLNSATAASVVFYESYRRRNPS